MGRANFYRKLKAITDLSPVDLIRNKRLEIAARMLLETDMNISEVSANIGFQFPCLFCYLFQSDVRHVADRICATKLKKNLYHYKLLLYVILLLFCQCKRDHSLKEEVTDLLRTEIVIRGDKALAEEPVTITAYRAERSAGGIHDFYSEGDYWWPNPINPDSAYIRRDGQTNPDNFVAHRHAMIRFSSLVGDLTSAWLVTKDEKYIRQAVKHIRAWFIAPETRMNPDLQYAQAIKGIVTGRGIGIIDTIHLLEVVQSLIRMEEAGVLAVEDVAGSRAWFSDYLKWLTTHPYGVDEMNAKNNHGTCWVMQVAQFAKYTGDKEILDFCRNRYRSVSASFTDGGGRQFSA
mgnify:CR=1 FL=1